MKKFAYIIIGAFLGVFSLLSCNREESSGTLDGEVSSLDLSLMTDDGFVKSSEGQGYEDTLMNVQLLFFNNAGTIDRFYFLSDRELGRKKAIVSDLKIGDYTVVAIANGPIGLRDSIRTLKDLANVEIDLKKYNKPSGDDAGFIMSGKGITTIERGKSNDLTITLRRYVGRVAVTAIQNKIPIVHDNLLVEHIFLTNVMGVTDLAGTDRTTTASVAQWLNKEGRDDYTPRDSSRIIDGITYRASAESLTYTRIEKNVPVGSTLNVNRYFYAYTNSSIIPPHGFNTVFEPQRTVLVVVASLAGVRYYYPVPLVDGISANATTNVKLTILGPGSDDPAVLAKKGSLVVDVEVEPWEKGQSYDKNL